jgi:hypothetical protein
MRQERIDLMEQIDRCRRLAGGLADEEMREALEELAEEYEAKLQDRNGEGFMLRASAWKRGAQSHGDGGNAAGAR